MEVISKEFYHIHRLVDNNRNPNKYSEEWRLGGVLEFGNRKNLLHDRIFDLSINSEREADYLQWLFRNYNGSLDIKQQKQSQANFFHGTAIFRYLEMVRETALEQVRISNFPDKPSRLNGIWLSDFEGLKKWSKILPSSSFPQQIFRVEFSGKLHRGDERWITNTSLSLSSYYKNALGYWEGLPQSKRGKPGIEYLGEGRLTIIQEVDLKEILNSSR